MTASFRSGEGKPSRSRCSRSMALSYNERTWIQYSDYVLYCNENCGKCARIIPDSPFWAYIKIRYRPGVRKKAMSYLSSFGPIVKWHYAAFALPSREFDSR